jgi:hypothetical protein
MTPVPILLPANTRLISIPMSRFTVNLEYFVVNGDQVNLLVGDEVIARNVMVMMLAADEQGIQIIALAIPYEETGRVVEALQTEEMFIVELILPTDATTTPVLPGPTPPPVR